MDEVLHSGLLEHPQESNGLGPAEDSKTELGPYNQATLQRVAPDDPNRCEGQGQHGRCPFRAAGTKSRIALADPADPSKLIYTDRWDGSAYCPRHQGMSVEMVRKDRLRIYHVAKWRDRIERHGDHPRIKSLREDIGVLRMTLEAKLERMEDIADLDMRSGQITSLVQEIARTIQIGHKIERESGYLLDRSQAIIFIEELLATISFHLKDEAILQKIAEAMAESVERAFPEPGVSKTRIHQPAY